VSLVPVYLDADSCEARFVWALERLGFDVALGTREVAEGASDAEQLDRAVEMGRVMVTANTIDFARLHHSRANVGIEHFGIVTRSQERQRSPEALAAALFDLLNGLTTDQLRNAHRRI
jgi:hypothetical protein